MSPPCSRPSDTYQHIEPALVGNCHALGDFASFRGAATSCSRRRAMGIDIDREDVAAGAASDQAPGARGLHLRGGGGQRRTHVPPHPARLWPPVRADRLLRHNRAPPQPRPAGRGDGQGEGRRRRSSSPRPRARARWTRSPPRCSEALVGSYPVLRTVRLTDYKVRILDSTTGTAATTRVLIDFQSGSESWTTVGASANIIEASWRALSDSMEYALLRLATAGAGGA
ncbi:MAG: hypothetical protein M0C28_32585 [Candidatus Moduliflexus flocculans]|nr:hypothetical protein [Candidatus Moduliflexus flocculans]